MNFCARVKKVLKVWNIQIKTLFKIILERKKAIGKKKNLQKLDLAHLKNLNKLNFYFMTYHKKLMNKIA